MGGTNVMGKYFYQRVLQVYEEDNSIVIHRIEKIPSRANVVSYVPQVFKVTVYGSRVCDNRNQGYQKIMFVKELPSVEDQNKYRTNIAVQNESRAYAKIIPTLKVYSARKLPFADCIYNDKDAIVMQDLTVAGFQAIGTSNGGLTIEQCELVLEALAKFHAASLVFRSKNPLEFKKCIKMVKDNLFPGGDSIPLSYLNQIFHKVIELFQKFPVNEENFKVLRVLEELKQTARPILKNILLHSREYSVFCHGDPWTENIMIDSNNEIKLIDLQVLRYNSVATDLCYLLYVNLEPEVRVQNTERLLEHYLSALIRNMKETGVNMENVLTKHWLQMEMDAFAIYGFIFGIWLMPHFFSRKDDVEISKEILRDVANFGNHISPDCERRIKELVYDYVRNLK